MFTVLENVADKIEVLIFFVSQRLVEDIGHVFRSVVHYARCHGDKRCTSMKGRLGRLKDALATRREAYRQGHCRVKIKISFHSLRLQYLHTQIDGKKTDTRKHDMKLI